MHRIIPIVGLLACIGCRTHTRLAPILLFAGTGTSPGDVAAIESILHANHFDYATVSSRDLNSLTVPQFHACRLLIVPGGNFIHIGSNLTPQASANIRTAVESGLNYLGICAGAFLAGHLPQNSFNLTSGVRFPFYSVVNRGIMKTSVPITFPNTPPMDHYWESGPELSGWGEVLARYPDGTPAIAQGPLGKGWIVLAGIHPEAPASWRHGLIFRTSAADDNAYVLTLISAALDARPLPHF